MTCKSWINEIKKQMALKDVESEGFENVIQTLAELLEQRDKIFKRYQDEGSEVMVLYTSDRGNENLIINPLLKEWQNMNRDALVYWRELGLTPASLKKINEDSMKGNEGSPLDKVLANLEKQSAPKPQRKPKAPAKPKTQTKAKIPSKTKTQTKSKGKIKVKK